ncbi:hypothetical protein DBIPINDM_007420 (plasmid) [Mesorhizobium sp. AR02]|uniref:hypothetical protein n=1 Tax=Mesorhizobium sp. AR02 TaxID=2865837 RepID=UPI00215F1AC1|nr:hypothetical protein [Mesorhizobium sp. AR02]UVK50131.1 hypothetical protein DBIPINDM_007420 [Mesorhizobium sp. AR02]
MIGLVLATALNKDSFPNVTNHGCRVWHIFVQVRRVKFAMRVVLTGHGHRQNQSNRFKLLQQRTCQPAQGSWPSGKANQEGRSGGKANDVKAVLIAVVVALTNGDPGMLTIGQANASPYKRAGA